MKTEQYRSLGLVANLEVPSTVEEFDTNAKKAGACLSEAVANVIYRGSLAELRDLFLHGRDEDKANGIPAFEGIEQATKIARKTKPTGKKDKDNNDIEVYAETEAEYFERVCAERKVEATSFQPLMDAACKLVKFDASQRERKPAAPKKLAAKYKETALAILKGAKKDKFLKDVKRDLGKEPTLTGDLEKDSETLGWVVKEYADFREKQALLSMVG